LSSSTGAPTKASIPHAKSICHSESCLYGEAGDRYREISTGTQNKSSEERSHNCAK